MNSIHIFVIWWMSSSVLPLQVITWFQNRRAKLKRDMEELKKDVESVKQLSAHKSFLENVNDLSILKTRPVSRHHQQPHQHHSEVIHTAAAFSHGSLGTPTGAAPAAATATAGPTSSVQHQPSPVPVLRPHPQPHPNVIPATTTITTNTCNETRDVPPVLIISSPPTKSPGEDSTRHPNSGQPQQHQQQSPHPPQSTRILQINNSRG